MTGARMGSSLAWGNVKSRQPGLRQPSDREKWELLQGQPKFSVRDRQQLAKVEFIIGKLKMGLGANAKSDGNIQAALDLYAEAISKFGKALMLGPESKLKKEIGAKHREATSEMLECERILQEKAADNKPS